MERIFRVSRRRKNIVDMTIFHTLASGYTGYRVKAATNFDATFNDIILDTGRNGFVDGNVNRNVIDTQPINGVRVVFDPDSFTGVGLADDSSFWLQVVPLIDTTEQTAASSAPTLILPDMYHYGTVNVVIAGDAPTSELQLDFTHLLEDIRFVNTDDTNFMSFGFEEGGPKYVVLEASEVSLPVNGTGGSIYVLADTATVAFSMVGTLAFPQ